MRIIGNIQHPTLKITVFKMDNKLSIKFESGLYEQTFKFRESNLMASFEDAERLVNSDFCDAVAQQMKEMHRLKNAALSQLLPSEEQAEFDEII